MDINLIERIFPPIENNKKLKYDVEGLWSITHPKEADIITEMLLNFYKNKFDNFKNIIITDTTAGLGGNTISFAKKCTFVNSIEIFKSRFKILENNINIYKFNNVKLYNDNFLNIINDIKQDIIFIDPPWGGPNYKQKKKINILINNINLYDIINDLYNKCKIVGLKLPINFNIKQFSENINYPITKYYIKNLLIIIITMS